MSRQRTYPEEERHFWSVPAPTRGVLPLCKYTYSEASMQVFSPFWRNLIQIKIPLCFHPSERFVYRWNFVPSDWRCLLFFLAEEEFIAILWLYACKLPHWPVHDDVASSRTYWLWPRTDVSGDLESPWFICPSRSADSLTPTSHRICRTSFCQTISFDVNLTSV